MSVHALEDVLEKDWQRTVVDLAKQLGWKRIYHTFDSRRSTHGFPDLVICRDRVIYLELKREKGKLSPEQVTWLRALWAAGAEAYVVRPSQAEALASMLASRHKVYNDVAALTHAEIGAADLEPAA